MWLKILVPSILLCSLVSASNEELIVDPSGLLVKQLSSEDREVKTDALIRLATIEASLASKGVVEAIGTLLDKETDRFCIEEALDAFRARALLISVGEAEPLWSSVEGISKQLAIKPSKRDPASDLSTTAFRTLLAFATRADAASHPFSRATVQRIVDEYHRDSNSRRKDEMIQLLANVEEPEGPAAKLLIGFMNSDPEVWVREHAARTLANYKTVQVRTALISKLESAQSDTWNVNEAVLDSLVGYGETADGKETFTHPEAMQNPAVQHALLRFIKNHNDSLVVPIFCSWMGEMKADTTVAPALRTEAEQTARSLADYLSKHATDEENDDNTRLAIERNVEALRAQLPVVQSKNGQ